MAVDIRKAHRRLIEEAFGKGNLEAYDEICDASCRFHDPLAGDSGLQEEKQICVMYRSAFPDLRPTILASYADGDTAVTHWRMTGTNRGSLMGAEPTGKSGEVEGISIAKFRNGRIAETWVQWDALGLFRQLGVVPSAMMGAGAAVSETRAHV